MARTWMPDDPTDPHNNGQYHAAWDQRSNGGFYMCPECRAKSSADIRALIEKLEARRVERDARRAAAGTSRRSY